MKNSLLKAFFLIAITFALASCQNKQSNSEKMEEFAEQYTAAWNSMVPEKMASFYAEDGVLTINGGTPSKGREQLAASVNSFMEAFPDLHLTLDSLVEDSGTYSYHWTFAGTNTGPGGKGNKVVFSGSERWTMNENGLIQNSIGTYDAEDYDKQVNGENGIK